MDQEKEDELRKTIKEAMFSGKKDFKYTIKETYQLKLLFRHIQTARNLAERGKGDEVRTLLKKIIKILTKEEKIEVRLQKAFAMMKEDLEDIEPLYERRFPNEMKGTKELLEKATQYSTDINQLASESGKIDSLIEMSKTDILKLDEAIGIIQKCFRDLQEFNMIISNLLNKYKHVTGEYERIRKRAMDLDVYEILRKDLARKLIVDEKQIDQITQWFTIELEQYGEDHEGYGSGWGPAEKVELMCGFLAEKAEKKIDGSEFVNHEEKTTYLNESDREGSMSGTLDLMDEEIIEFGAYGDGYAFSIEIDEGSLKKSAIEVLRRA